MVLINESVSKIHKLKNCTIWIRLKVNRSEGLFKSDSIMQLEVILWFKFMNKELLL